MRLAGEIAIVTGAGRGIGAETAHALAEAGAAVAVTARRSADAETVAGAIVSAGGKAVGLACDVADAASIAHTVGAVREALGPATILVNNAAVIEPIGSFHEIEPAAFAASIAVNLVGAAEATRAVLPDMIAASRGTIVNVSSGAARIPFAGWSAYCTGKAGLLMLGRVLAAEYGAAGIRVFGFAPGIVDTGMQEQIRAAGIGPTATTPRERLAHPREPALGIVFLCTPEAAPFVGSEVDVRSPEFREAAGLPALAT